MIHFNSEVLLTRFWQLSPEVQQIMTVVDSYVNANTKNFNWLEKIKRPNLNDKLSVTNERIKALRMVKLEERKRRWYQHFNISLYRALATFSNGKTI
jgi:hypothetical protein